MIFTFISTNARVAAKLVVADLVVLVHIEDIDLSLAKTSTSLVAVRLMLYGFVWDAA